MLGVWYKFWIGLDVNAVQLKRGRCLPIPPFCFIVLLSENGGQWSHFRSCLRLNTSFCAEPNQIQGVPPTRENASVNREKLSIFRNFKFPQSFVTKIGRKKQQIMISYNRKLIKSAENNECGKKKRNIWKPSTDLIRLLFDLILISMKITLTTMLATFKLVLPRTMKSLLGETVLVMKCYIWNVYNYSHCIVMDRLLARATALVENWRSN